MASLWRTLLIQNIKEVNKAVSDRDKAIAELKRLNKLLKK